MRRSTVSGSTLAFALALAAACSAPADGNGLTLLPLLSSVPLTTTKRLEPVHAVDANGTLSPAVVADLESMLASGFGEVRDAPGEPLQARNLDGTQASALPAGAVRLARFVHLADTQLADDESPARVAKLDSIGTASGAFRPQEAYGCLVLRAAVRTINGIHRGDALDAVILGGDNADDAQNNEVDWFLKILAGSDYVHCDSGDDNDPVPGPNNDPKDPFASEGLVMPWRWVTGNHDILNQGTIRITVNPDEPIGTRASTGTRDWSMPGGPVRSGEFVTADPDRFFLGRSALMAKVAADGDGHGIGAAQVASGRAHHAFDVGSNVRVVALDTAAETGSAEGVVHRGDVDTFLKPTLDAAKAAGKLVIITSHHASGSLTDGSQTGGTKQADAVSIEDFQALLSSYPNVIMHLAGHSHVHAVKTIAPAAARPYWEVKTAALADFPNELRVFEVWDTGEGHIVIRSIAFDYSTTDDVLAAEARARAITDYTSGWAADGRGTVAERNVDLWLAKP